MYCLSINASMHFFIIEILGANDTFDCAHTYNSSKKQNKLLDCQATEQLPYGPTQSTTVAKQQNNFIAEHRNQQPLPSNRTTLLLSNAINNCCQAIKLTSCIKALCLSTFLAFIILTIAA